MEINYDEQYAVSVAIVIYEQLYNKKYLPKDFIVENKEFGEYGSVWNVYLKETRQKFIDNDNIIYDGITGLFISKENGGILVNIGEED